MNEQEYCQFALEIQDACNLSGVVFNWGQALQACDFFQGTQHRNTHPATVLIVDKLLDLANRSASYSDAYGYCKTFRPQEEKKAA